MKGIVFTEFLEMVEEKFGYQMVDTIISKSELESDGVYTSVGTYDHAEIVQLLSNLSDETEIQAEVLLEEFGKYMFDTFFASYPQFFDSVDSTFDFLSSIDSYIHVEVLKLYPEATLPRFETKTKGDVMTMIYISERKMSALALGLIEKSIAHFGEKISIKKEDLKEDGSKVKFILIRE